MVKKILGNALYAAVIASAIASALVVLAIVWALKGCLCGFTSLEAEFCILGFVVLFVLFFGFFWLKIKTGHAFHRKTVGE